MSNTERPLSPHLSIYRWPITMTLSILHRATGAGMAVGLVVLAIWLHSAASGAGDYDQFVALMSTLVGRILLIGWSFAFFYHLANGIRHLVWDSGRGFAKHQANASAWFVLVFSVASTVVFWMVLS
jgi:succinate dehydrogenase / fumarate reductase cytochrome b subunit